MKQLMIKENVLMIDLLPLVLTLESTDILQRLILWQQNFMCIL
jgi:hypothetical protein